MKFSTLGEIFFVCLPVLILSFIFNNIFKRIIFSNKWELFNYIQTSEQQAFSIDNFMLVVRSIRDLLRFYSLY